VRSANLELVQSLYAGWERGDYSSVEWAHPEIEFVIADGPSPGSWRGIDGMTEGFRSVLSAWEDWRAEPDEYRELDEERVLVLIDLSGRGKASGVEVDRMRAKGANLFHIRGGKVTRLAVYWDRERALADVGLEGGSGSQADREERAAAPAGHKPPDRLRRMAPSRSYDRSPGDLRPVEIEPGFVRTADGSALYSQGETRVICTASVTTSVPRWMDGSGRGWVTAEYAMLPASTGERKERDIKRGRPDGRSVEIQRLIGRSLRAVVDLEALGERSVYVDCDVLQADGGTRCAAITGGYVALRLALAQLIEVGELERDPLTGSIAAVSCGVVDGDPLLDLDYSEDSRAEVDANVVMSGDGGLVEVQATAERTPVSRASLDDLLALAEPAIAQLRDAQRDAVAGLAG
jgi:ribonuclease PH